MDFARSTLPFQSRKIRLETLQRSGKFSPLRTDRSSQSAPVRSARHPMSLVLDRVISEATSCNKLMLSSRSLSHFPEVKDLVDLTSVDLSGNSFSELPQQVVNNARTLLSLYFYGNNLESVGDEFAAFVQLQELHLSFNRIETISPNVGQLQNLRKLNLNNNALSTLPSSIGELRSLEELNLAYNQLVLLPAELGKLVCLRVLHVENNHLLHLPFELGFCSDLEVLTVAGNSLLSPSSDVIEQGIEAIMEFLKQNIPAEIDISWTSADGLGICEATAGETSQFRIVARDQFGQQLKEGGENFVVQLIGPTDKVSIAGTDMNDGSYIIEYSTEVAGKYELSVTLDGDRHIVGSPFTVDIYPNKTSPKHCSASGRALYEITAGEKASIELQARDQYNNARIRGGDVVRVYLVDSESTVYAHALDQSNGKYNISFRLDRAGLYEMVIQVNGEHILGSPYSLSVASSSKPPPPARPSFEERARVAMQARSARKPI